MDKKWKAQDRFIMRTPSVINFTQRLTLHRNCIFLSFREKLDLVNDLFKFKSKTTPSQWEVILCRFSVFADASMIETVAQNPPKSAILHTICQFQWMRRWMIGTETASSWFICSKDGTSSNCDPIDENRWQLSLTPELSLSDMNCRAVMVSQPHCTGA